ncbi:hypothetical protein LUZ60_001078 [Juncus effusus]|nr:hypothetical protein LUZ60_001078 [Juncus effusus]
MAIHCQDQPNSRTDLLQPEEKNDSQPTSTTKLHGHGSCSYLLIVLNFLALFIGTVTASLLSRYYFLHGGSSRWLATLAQSVGFPLLFLPLYLSPSSSSRPFSHFTTRLYIYSIFLGLLMGINNLLFAVGTSYLPVSTTSLLLSTQLGFTLVLAAILVRLPLTFQNLNTVVLLTLSSLLLAVQQSDDAETIPGESTMQYYLGFAATLGAAGLFAAYLPLMEIVYRSVTGGFRMVVELQIIMQAVATVLAIGGMIAANTGEENWDLSWTAYWVVLIATVICWQLCFIGTAGMVFLTSSLPSGICMTALLPINVLAGVAAFGDEFGFQKAIAMALCLWGFSSYIYGEQKKINSGHGEDQEKVCGMHGGVGEVIGSV